VLALDEASLVECLGHLEAIRDRPPDDRSEAYDLGHLLLALDVIGRQLQHEQAAPLSIDPRASSLVTAAIDLLDRDLQRRWTLDDLASRLYVGTYHLIRQFDRWVGLPPIAYLNRRRAERAASLLATTDGAIAAIGAQVGWPDASQFSRRFRQHMEMSPLEYRARSRRHYAARRRNDGHPAPAEHDIDAPSRPTPD
jgi:AraC family L-rhamnose operon transcriptional activator RhaR